MTIDQILEETGQEIRTAASVMAVPELQLKTRRQVAPRPRRLVTAGASAFLVMLAVLLVTLIPLGDDSSFVDQPPVTTAPPITTAPPTPAAAVPSAPIPTIAWTRIDDPAVFGEADTWINTVAMIGDTLFAGGSDGKNGIVWSSADGATWSRVDDSGQAFGSQNSPWGDGTLIAVFDFASLDGKTVAVGLDSLVDGWDEPSVAAFWYVDDAGTWHRVPHDDDLFGDSRVNSVVAHDGSFLAVGSAIWQSADGIDWDRIGEAPKTALGHVISTDYGLMAAGDDGQEAPAIYRSGDGTSWIQAEVGGTSEGFNCSTYDIVEAEDGLFAVGCSAAAGGPTASNRNAAVWRSDDGSVWSMVERAASSRHDNLWGIVADGNRLVAAGDTTQPSYSNSGLIWISVDGGSTWEPQIDDGFVFGNIRSETRHAFIRSITLFEGKFIVVGAYTTGGPPMYHAAVWIGEWDE